MFSMVCVNAQNQLYMGPYTSDALASTGVGLKNCTELIKVGTLLPIDLVQRFEGAQVKAIRIGLCAPITEGAVFVYPVTKLAPLTLGEPWIWQEVASTVNGWNLVQLDTPCTVNTEGIVGLMLGYQYRQTTSSASSDYPISLVEEGDLLKTYAYCQLNYSSAKWRDVGLGSYGNLSVQALVEGDDFIAYDMRMSDLHVDNYAQVDSGLNFTATLSNQGTQTLVDYAIDVLVDGEVTDQLVSPGALTNAEVTLMGHCSIEGLTAGSHDFGLRIASVGGEPVADGTLLTAHFKAYTDAFPRQKQLVEQFTSQYCTHCPLGEQVLDAVDKLRNGDVAWVAIHGNMTGTDVFSTQESEQMISLLGVNSFPQAAFNRYNPNGSSSPAIPIGFSDVQLAAQAINNEFFENNIMPALANIRLSGTLDQSTNLLTVKVEGDATGEFQDVFGNSVGLTVYLVEDSLVSRQLNNGTWIQQYVHNHVLRDVVSATTGDALLWSQDNSHHYANTLQTTLRQEWILRNMSLVAFVHRKGSTREVINCAMVSLPKLLEPTVSGDVTGDAKVDIADINAAIDMMLGKAEKSDAADITGDGNIDIADINAMIDIMLGK